MRVGFLIHVDMSLVRNSVAELTRLSFKNSYQYMLFRPIQCYHLITEGEPPPRDRAIGLFEAAHGEDKFDEEYADQDLQANLKYVWMSSL